MRKYFLGLSLIACIFLVTLTNLASAKPTAVTLFAAGSLTDALSEVATAFTQRYNFPVKTVFGPSGQLRQSLEKGEQADVFASADTGNPITLSQENLSGPVVTFVRNRLCAFVRPGLSVTPDNLLDQLLNPDIKLATSTPVSDPAGDYAEQVFRSADQLRPGSFQTLEAKALRLVGGPNSPPVPAGRNSTVYFIEDTHQADIFLVYCTGAQSALQQAPTLQVVELPANLAVQANYGLTILKDASKGGPTLALYILSPAGQKILAKYGFSTPLL